jgi:cell division protease FtsH
MEKPNFKIIMWIAIALMIFSLFKQVNTSDTSVGQTSYSDFLDQVRAGHIKNVDLISLQNGDMRIIAITTDDKHIQTTATVLDRGLIGDLVDNHVKFDVRPREEPSMLLNILMSWGPMILMIGVYIYFMKKMQGGGAGGIGNFGKSKAKHDLNPPTTTFADVAGCDEAKYEVSELVEFLRSPARFQKLGGKMPRGVLLVGPPGTGKTLLARAMAGEAKVPFFSGSGSDFVEMFVGVGAARVRDMFETARKHAPCIIFIDEIDAVGKKRGNGLGGGGNDEREQTLNQMLVEMDGFATSETPIIVIAATNRPDVLDPALMRPGRFDRQVTIPLPDIRGREQILSVYLRKVPASPNIEASIIARGTPGMSGADLENLVNEAALFAARRNGRFVEMQDFEMAKDKILMGTARKLVMPEEERRNTAYHESGHALIGKLLPKCHPVHKVTIMPRGRALGVTVSLPEFDTFTYDKEFLLSQIAMLFGGRIAEEVYMNQMTTGASNDFERATDIARNMVTKWGMSDTLGPMVHGEHEGAFGGRKDVSEGTMLAVDAEVKRILREQYMLARKLIEDHADKMHAMASALLEWETIDADQIQDIMENKPPRPPKELAVVEPKPPTDGASALLHVPGIDPESEKLAQQLGMRPLTPEDKEQQDKK